MDRMPGVIVVVAGTKGKVDGGNVVLGAGLGDRLAWPISVVAVACAGESPAPWTMTVRVSWAPTAAVARM